MSGPHDAPSAGVALTTATRAAGSAAGTASRRAGASLQRLGSTLESGSAAAAPRVGAAVDSALAGASTAATVAARTVGDTVSGLVEDPGVRVGAAVNALRGQRVGPPLAVRRWPWAVLAALLGAMAGAGLAWFFQRLGGSDAPGAQEAHELRAVVDLTRETPPAGEAQAPAADTRPDVGPTA